jgi:hypothetical protein
MFSGRNRSNGLTTTKPVCVLSVDSLGSEVKKKNRALKIPYNPLISIMFSLLTGKLSFVPNES